MDITIIGGGSLGMLYASRIAAQHDSTTVVVHSVEQASAIMKDGITCLDEVERQAGSEKPSANSKPKAQAWQQWLDVRARHGEICRSGRHDRAEWLLLAVKQKDLNAAFIAALAAVHHPNMLIVCLQNGIGHMELLAEAIPSTALHVGVTTEGARRENNVTVAHTGRGITRIGPLQHNHDNESMEYANQLVSILYSAGFAAEASSNMAWHVWNKLLVNAVINPLTALLDVTNGMLLEGTYAPQLMRSLFEEGCAVAQAEQVLLDTESLWITVQEVCRLTSGNSSSMRQDLQQHRITEIEWILGSLLRLAANHPLQTPALMLIYQMIKAREEVYKQPRE